MENKLNKDINIQVAFDKDNVMKEVKWTASDMKDKKEKTSKSLMLYLWDKEELDSLCMNLWSKDMTVHEMKIHIFQIITFISDAYEKATNDESLKTLFIEFGNTFAKKTGIVKE